MKRIMDFFESDNGKPVIILLCVVIGLLALKAAAPKNVNISLFGEPTRTGVKKLWSSKKARG